MPLNFVESQDASSPLPITEQKALLSDISATLEILSELQ